MVSRPVVRNLSLLGLLAVIPLTALAEPKIELGLDLGARRDSLRWNIASDPSGTVTPNILSELTFSDLQIASLGLQARLVSQQVELRASVGKGNINGGRTQDSDYSGDDRTMEFSRSTSENSGDEVTDLSVSLGWRLPLTSGYPGETSYLLPLAGYSYHGMDLRMTDATQEVASASTPPLGPVSGVNSTYQARWSSLWLGLEAAHESVRNNLGIYTRLEYHSAQYHAEADWNMRTDFQHPKSFEHNGDGQGVVVSIGIFNVRAEGFRWRLSYDTSRWRINSGRDRVYFTDGTISETRLNEAEWKSNAINLTLGWQLPEKKAP